MSLFVDIEKKLGSFHLKVKFASENGVLSLMGASGCGKSMTLKCIAGIEKPDRGRIILDGLTLFDSEKKINLPPQKRKVGLLFQNYALFPNMTAEENIRAGANRIKDKEEKERKIRELMEKFGISELAGHYPSQLSGGQQQRIALARILISEPDCLLLDEPFSALDTHLRFRTERETAKVIGDFGKTVILVSHNINEVFRLTDNIAIMNYGGIDVIGNKTDVLSNPETVNAALLTGRSNISEAEITDENHIRATDWGITLRTAEAPGTGMPVHGSGAPLFVGIRPEQIVPATDEDCNTFEMNVDSAADNPYSTALVLTSAGGTRPLTCSVSNEWWQKNKAGTVRIHIPAGAVALLK